MIKCGTDIIEVGRIKEALEKKGFKGRVYTDIIENKYKIKWTDFEILNDKSGKPYVNINAENIKKLEIKNIELSISHCKEYATAVCIVEL